MRPHTPCPCTNSQAMRPYSHPSTTPPTLRAHARSIVVNTITTPLSRSASATFQVRRQHGALSCTPSSARCPPTVAAAHASAVAPAALLDPLRPLALSGQRVARRMALIGSPRQPTPQHRLRQHMWQPAHAALDGNYVLSVECNLLRVELPFSLFYAGTFTAFH